MSNFVLAPSRYLARAMNCLCSSSSITRLKLNKAFQPLIKLACSNSSLPCVSSYTWTNIRTASTSPGEQQAQTPTAKAILEDSDKHPIDSSNCAQKGENFVLHGLQSDDQSLRIASNNRPKFALTFRFVDISI